MLIALPSRHSATVTAVTTILNPTLSDYRQPDLYHYTHHKQPMATHTERCTSGWMRPRCPIHVGWCAIMRMMRVWHRSGIENWDERGDGGGGGDGKAIADTAQFQPTPAVVCAMI